ncbi:MAG: hypothetical protein Fur0014_21560 [Rubrivivax sp.]
MKTPASPPPAGRPHDNPLLEIVVTILVPALVLMQLSKPERLGTTWALVLALAFPLGWGIREAVKKRKLSWLALLGVVSTLLTGGIGLLKVDPFWLAVKEAAVPSLIGLAILGSNWTRWPLIRILVFNPQLFDVEKVEAALKARGTTVPFELRLRTGTLWLAGTFFFSAVANFLLTRWVVTSPAGSEAFNEELGRLTLLSYPIIALPSMAMMMGLMWWLATGAKKLTGLELGDMLRG